MSWNNVIPWYIYDMRREKDEAMMLCATAEELNSGWVRSCPKQFIQMDLSFNRREDRKLYSLGVQIF